MSESNVAIVTGASGGIGRAIAEAMLAAGHHVVSLDRRMPDWSHAKLEPVAGGSVRSEGDGGCGQGCRCAA